MKKLFLKMMMKSRRVYLTALFSAIFIVAIVFFSLTVGSGLLYVSEKEVAKMTPLIFKMEDMFLVPYLLLMFLQILILLEYIRKRSKDYAMLTVLGMKKKHRYLFMAGEYVSLIIGAVVFGLAFGALGGMAVKPLLKVIFRDVTEDIIYGTAPLKVTLIVCGIMFGIGFMICDQIVSCLGMEYVISGRVKAEKAYKKSTKVFLFAGSMIILCILWLLTLNGIVSDLAISAATAAAMGLVLNFGGKYYLEHLRKKKKTYYGKLLWIDGWYERFSNHMNKSFIVAVFLFLMVFSANLMILDNVPVTQPESYPYDLVWHGNLEDEAFLKVLKDTYGIRYQTIPEIRITSGDHGEHMGISVSEYENWTGNKISLSDNEIYVVYQNDRSEKGKTGIDYGAFTPDLYIGNATWLIWVSTPTHILPSNQFTRKYHVAGSGEQIVTGNFKSKAVEAAWKTELFDEIIVFSDPEYEKIRQEAEGADLAVLMDIPKEYDQVSEAVHSYAKEHSEVDFFDPEGGNLIYERIPCMIENRQDKIFQICTAAMNLIILFVCILMILIEATESKREKQKWKVRYLYRLGMDEKKRKKNFYQEILFTPEVGLFGGIPLGFLFMMAKALYKNIGASWTLIYLLEGIGISLLLCVLYLMIMKLVARRRFSKVEGEYKNE